MSRPSPRALECLLSVAEHGTIFAAAIDIGISPQAASKLIRRLESSLGCKVLTRNGFRGVELTERGRELLPLATEVVGAYGRLAEVAA